MLSIVMEAGIAHSTRLKLERVFERYLKMCYSSRTSARVSELAQAIGVTRQHLTRICRAVLGVSAHRALRQRQLAYAEHLLLSTPLSTAEIALLAGFGTESTFFRQFETHYGMTPKELRKQVPKR